MKTIRNIETIQIYGCNVIHCINENIYKYFVGDVKHTVITTNSRLDMAYYINQMQSKPY